MMTGLRARPLKFTMEGRLLGVRTFNAGGVYTPTPGTTSVEVIVVGGGGGGGGGAVTAGGQAAAGAGGGGGGWAMKFITTGFAGVQVVVGAGGIGVSGANGTAGGNSQFGALVSATGGTGGSLGAAQPTTFSGAVGFGSPGIGQGGDINGTGGPGMYALYGGTVPTSGGGGSSYCGAGALWAQATAGPAAAAKGGGGGGSSSTASNGANIGGNGAPGVVIIREYA